MPGSVQVRVRAPQGFFLKAMCSAISSARTSSLIWIFFCSRAMRFPFGLVKAAVVGPWGSSLPLAWRLYLPESWARDRQRRRRSQRTLSASGRKPWAETPAGRRVSRPARCRSNAASEGRPSLGLCSAFVASSCVLSVSLTAERSSPVPAEAGQSKMTQPGMRGGCFVAGGRSPKLSLWTLLVLSCATNR